jgi:predicted nucleic acid-binding protein
MKIIRLPKGLAGRTEARLVMTRSGDRIRAIVSIERPMQGMSEDGYHETLEKAEQHAINLAERYRADVLYIEDKT